MRFQLVKISRFPQNFFSDSASTRDELDLQIGDVINLDSSALEVATSSRDQEAIATHYAGRNARTQQVGRVSGEKIHVLPTLGDVDERLVVSSGENIGKTCDCVNTEDEQCKIQKDKLYIVYFRSNTRHISATTRKRGDDKIL